MIFSWMLHVRAERSRSMTIKSNKYKHMKYSKFFQYAYLVFAVLFIYDAVSKYVNNGEVAYASILLSALAVFMFFFRRKFSKKFENRNNQS